MKDQQNSSNFLLTGGLLIAVIVLSILLFRSNRTSDSTDAERSESTITTGSLPSETPATNPAPDLAAGSEPSGTNTPPSAAATNTPPSQAGTTNEPPTTQSVATDTAGLETPPSDEEKQEDEGIQLSFKGANIDMIVEWLAKTSGKSVVKHPQVRCQLTIVNSTKLPVRDAINLVYRALSLEGFTTIESSQSILIVPEANEPKLSPEFTNGSVSEIPEGRQRLVKIFDLEFVPASEVKDRLQSVLSEKGTVEVDERGNKLIVTDYTDNIRLISELLPELDGASGADTVIEIYRLKHLEADEMAGLLNMVLNNQAAPPSSGSSSSSSLPPGMPPGMVVRSSSSSSSSRSSAPPPTGAIRFWADNTSNRLIVSSPRAQLPEIQDLIERLDTEKPADVGVRVLTMKHVNATDLVREIAPLYRRMSGQSLKDTIEVAANERSNSLIVLSSESNFHALQQFVARLDTENAQQKVLRSFPLKNADAEDVAEQLRELNQEGNNFTRYVYYYSTPGRSSTQKMQVVADRRRNTVIVQASPSEMDSVAELIEALDEPVADNALAPRIYPLKYVSAVDIEDVLNELFLREDTQRDYWDYYYGPSQQDDSEDVGRLFGKVRITSEPYSNAIIVTANSTENLEAVEEILNQLDVPSEAGDSTLKVQLNFADSVTVANSINILFAKGGSPPLRNQPQQPPQNNNRAQQPNAALGLTGFELEQEQEEDMYFPWLGGQQDNSLTGEGGLRPASDLVGRIRAVPDKRSNSLLLTANVHYFPQVIKLINELDTPTAQVMIEAKIIEVSTDFRDRFGVRWSPDGSQVFDTDDLDGSISPSVAGSFQRIFSGSTAPDARQFGVLDATVNLDILIQFLKKNTDATVLAEPQLNVSDNEMGKLFVGAQVPFISSSLNTDVGGRNDSFQYKDVGIILEVTPQINNSQQVALKIRAESSNIRNGETLFGGAILDTRNFRTEVMVKSGETVVLGGIIQKQDGEIVRKVPLLGDIPLLGWIFKKKDSVTRDVELMVFLKPKISRSPEEARAMSKEAESKMPRLQRWRQENEYQPEVPDELLQ